eukprot:s4048_g5.t2
MERWSSMVLVAQKEGRLPFHRPCCCAVDMNCLYCRKFLLANALQHVFRPGAWRDAFEDDVQVAMASLLAGVYESVGLYKVEAYSRESLHCRGVSRHLKIRPGTARVCFAAACKSVVKFVNTVALTLCAASGKGAQLRWRLPRREVEDPSADAHPGQADMNGEDVTSDEDKTGKRPALVFLDAEELPFCQWRWALLTWSMEPLRLARRPVKISDAHGCFRSLQKLLRERTDAIFEKQFEEEEARGAMVKLAWDEAVARQLWQCLCFEPVVDSQVAIHGILDGDSGARMIQSNAHLYLQWTPRLQNREADSLTHEDYQGFDPKLRLRFSLDEFEGIVTNDRLEAGAHVFKEAQEGREKILKKAGKRTKGAGLRETDPWCNGTALLMRGYFGQFPYRFPRDSPICAWDRIGGYMAMEVVENKNEVEATPLEGTSEKAVTSSDKEEVIIGGKFRLGSKIGSGSFGAIHLGVNLRTGEEVAIKLEPLKSRHPQLLYEAKIYKGLAGSVGIPSIHWYGVQDAYTVMVLDLLGPSLEDLLNFCKGRLSLKTVLMIADQMINRLECVHSRNVIHRDVKPDNFLLGLGRRANQVNLIDFGLSKKYRDSKTQVHIPYREGKALTGTARYASINTHAGLEQSRRDDLEALGYVLIYLVKGCLPWQGLPSKTPKTKQERYDEIMQQKINTSLKAEESGKHGECGVNWIASSSGNATAALKPQSIKAQVPGDLLTDLEAAGEIGDPLYELNWLKSDIWAKQTWTYSANFSIDQLGLESGSRRVQLVFDGIKMGAHVKVNGKLLGTATSQFIRYSFDLDPTRSQNSLEVIFDQSIQVGGRFMASSGGWDWAPYTNTFQGDARTFTYGIWKHVYLVYTPSMSASITHVVPKIFYQGKYPTEALVDGEHAGFKVKLKVFLSAKTATFGSIAVQNSWDHVIYIAAMTVPEGNSSALIEMNPGNASAKDIKLWWPIGMGNQPLYDLSVTFEPNNTPSASVTAHRKVGFRYFALVTGNDTDPAYVTKAASEQGTDSHGMYFRINGAAFWSKGSNVIPMENLEGRMNGEAHRIMVRSAAHGGMNTLRIWGGGIFMPDEFYETCDELGLIVFHDMMYAQLGHAPAKTVVQDTELRHQVRRLSSHPSIVIWDGCNECTVLMGTKTEIYATFVMTVVAEEDDSRSIWPS